MDWVAYKQQPFISNSSEGWEVQDQCTSRFSIWRELASWFTDSCSLDVPSQGESGEGALWGLLYKGTNPIPEDSTVMTWSPQRLHLQILPYRRLDFNIWILGGHELSAHSRVNVKREEKGTYNGVQETPHFEVSVGKEANRGDWENDSKR